MKIIQFRISSVNVNLEFTTILYSLVKHLRKALGGTLLMDVQEFTCFFKKRHSYCAFPTFSPDYRFKYVVDNLRRASTGAPDTCSSME